MGRDMRTVDEKIADMLADDWDTQAIADKLQMTWGQVRRRYIAFCHKLSEEPDEN
jgi:hypothetical protein